MKIHWLSATKLGALTLLVAASANTNAQPSNSSSAESPGYQLKARDAGLASTDRSAVARANAYPLDKSYRYFTKEEKAALRSEYVNMPEEDEPPFPSRGLKDIIGRLSRLSGDQEVTGELTIFVQIDARGTPRSVSLVQYPDLEFAKIAALMLMDIPYKAAVCGGRPCPGEVPIRFSFQAEK